MVADEGQHVRAALLPLQVLGPVDGGADPARVAALHRVVPARVAARPVHVVLAVDEVEAAGRELVPVVVALGHEGGRGIAGFDGGDELSMNSRGGMATPQARVKFALRSK